MINKSATHAATIDWKNGNSCRLYVGSNRNTGETIVWQVATIKGKLGRSTRITGGNIRRLAFQIANQTPSEGTLTVHNGPAYVMIEEAV